MLRVHAGDRHGRRSSDDLRVQRIALMRNTEEIWRLVDAKQDEFNALSDRVWEIPELCYGEFKSCAEHTEMLKAQGFRVTQNVAGIPTAVMGEARAAGPVVA